MAEHGLDPRSLIGNSGVSYEEILAKRPISCEAMSDVYAHVIAKAPADFALSCGQSIRLQYMGSLGYRLSNCATVGELLADWVRYSGNIGYPLVGSLKVAGDRWRMTFVPRFPMSPHAEEFCVTSTLAGFAKSVLNLSGHRISMRRIGFSNPAPEDSDSYLALAAEVTFGCPAPFVEGDREDLDRPIATADADLLQACEDLCQREWSQENSRVTERLYALFGLKGVVTLADASKHMGMSQRSLQRNLSMEGSGYTGVLDDYRHRRALVLLQQGRCSKSIAFELGFDHDSSFRRSFRGWTGVSVSEWRKDRVSV
ncbi:AraC family transcriptional regulator [Aurantiacibacter rhizosphaerae]|nr:AraC family transcriptional regulator [Aurantiacibacter rhizosphaerae]